MGDESNDDSINRDLLKQQANEEEENNENDENYENDENNENNENNENEEEEEEPITGSAIDPNKVLELGDRVLIEQED